ncbi:MAG: hypothetical protein R2855_13545 [Thermomicrobiales bacterium]
MPTAGAGISLAHRPVKLIAVGGAALLFVPWAAQVLRSIKFVGDDRVFLYVTWQKVFRDSFYSIVGLPGERAYYWGVSTARRG